MFSSSLRFALCALLLVAPCSYGWAQSPPHASRRPSDDEEIILRLTSASFKKRQEEESRKTKPDAPQVEKFPSYTDAMRECLREGKPLAVFVGTPARKIRGFTSCRWDDYPGGKTGIVVGVSVGGDMKTFEGTREYLSSSSSDDEVIDHAHKLQQLLLRGRQEQRRVTEAFSVPNASQSAPTFPAFSRRGMATSC